MSDELLQFFKQLINDDQGDDPKESTNDISKFPQVQEDDDPNVLFEVITSFFNDNYLSEDWKNVNAAISSLIYLCQPPLRKSDPKPENFFEFLLYVIPECLLNNAGEEAFSLRTKDSALWIIGQLLIAYPGVVENLDISSFFDLSKKVVESTDNKIIIKRACFLLSVLAKNEIILSSPNLQVYFTDFAQEVCTKIKKNVDGDIASALFSALNSFIPSQSEELIQQKLFDEIIYPSSTEIAYQSSISNLASSFFLRSPNLSPDQIIQHATYLLCFIIDTIGASPDYFGDDILQAAFFEGPEHLKESSYSEMYNMIYQNTTQRKFDPRFNTEIWASALIALLSLFRINITNSTPYFMFFSFPIFSSLFNAANYQDQDQSLKYLAIRGFATFFEIVDKLQLGDPLFNYFIDFLLRQLVQILTVQLVFPETQDKKMEIGVMTQVIENLLFIFKQILEKVSGDYEFFAQLLQYFFEFFDKIDAFLDFLINLDKVDKNVDCELDKVDKKQAIIKILKPLYFVIKIMGEKYQRHWNVQIVLKGMKFVNLVLKNEQKIFDQKDEIYRTAQKLREAMQQF